MATTGSIGSTNSSTADPLSSSSLTGLNTDSFLKLMIAQLQNQDPLNPTDNKDLLQQVNEIRNIGATDKLTETLNSVLLGQNLSSATALIGRQVEAADDKADKVSGIVDHVTVSAGVPKLHIGDKTVSLSNVTNIAPAG